MKITKFFTEKVDKINKAFRYLIIFPFKKKTFNIIIFSKDRASQLDLLLRSMEKNFLEYSNFKINVLYTYTNKDYREGYMILKSKFPNLNFVKEKSFKQDTMLLLKKNNKFTVFFVDDNVFKERFSLKDKPFRIFFSTNDIACLSLRLHPNLTYCYPADKEMKCPPMTKNNIFNWKGKDGDYGYPMSLDGHIFRTSDIFDKISTLEYTNPNTLENRLCSKEIHSSIMIMYDKSIILNIPANKVQDYNNNLHGEISSEYMNKQYLNGKIISLENINGINNISCHQEINILFKNNKNII